MSDRGRHAPGKHAPGRFRIPLVQSSRPKGGRPPGRRGRGGIGPGPGYRGGSTGKPTQHDNSCCPMVAALKSVKRGKFRLARRYAAMSARLIAGRLA